METFRRRRASSYRYGGEYGSMIDVAEEYEKVCKDTFNAIKEEMKQRGLR